MSSGANAYGDLLSRLFAPLDDPDDVKGQLAQLEQQRQSAQPSPIGGLQQPGGRLLFRQPGPPSAAELDESGIPPMLARPDLRDLNAAASTPAGRSSLVTGARGAAAEPLTQPAPSSAKGTTVSAVAPSTQGLPDPSATNSAAAPPDTLGARLKQLLDRQRESADQAYSSVQQLAAQPLETEALAPLQEQRDQAATPIDPSGAQYQASKWQKLSRGLKAALRGLESGGVVGAVAGPVLDADYGAPNARYAHDVDQQQNKLAGLDQQIGEQWKSYEERTNRLKDLARDYGMAAGLYGSASKNSIDEENAESQQARDEEIGRHNRVDEQEKTQRDAQEQANQQSQRRQEDRRIGIEGGRLQLERDKFNRENQAQGDDDPRRQPMIDEATQRVKDLEDEWQYVPSENMYESTKNGQEISPQRFTDLKNDISTKLDQALTSKKLKPLGVRFNVEDALGSQYKHERPQVGKPISVDGKQHMVIGWNDKTNKPIVDRNPIPDSEPQSKPGTDFVTHKGNRVAVGQPVNVNGRTGKVAGFNQATGKAQVQWDDGQ